MTTEERLAALERARDATNAELRAQRFVLVDENGKPRAALGFCKAGPMLGLYEENGMLRASLGLDKNYGPSLLLEGRERQDACFAEHASGYAGADAVRRER